MKYLSIVAAGLVLALACMPLLAEDSGSNITLTNTGINFAGSVGTVVVALGAIVLAVLGGVFAFKIIRIGLRWLNGLGK
jgi:hypothetical protein